jgi:hypothetical protein
VYLLILLKFFRIFIIIHKNNLTNNYMNKNKVLFFNLLVKLQSGKTIQINNLNYEITTVELLKMHIAYQSKIPIDYFEIYWNNEILGLDSVLLKDIIICGEKLPINRFNVNNIIIMKIHDKNL